jgi:hypothetical protein
MAEGARHQSRHSQQVEPQAALLLRQKILQTAPPHRECLLPPQRLPAHRHALRQARSKLPSLHLPCRRSRLVDFMSLGPSKVKLPAGDLILYPASSQHRIEPVTRGTRVAAYFWIQSLVRDDTRRRLLHEMDVAIGQLRADVPDHAALRKLLGVYHNLLRFWSDT